MRATEGELSGRSALAWYLFAGTLAGLGLIGKAPLLGKIAHLPHAAALLLAVLLPLGPFLWRFGFRCRRLLGVGTAVLLGAIFLTVVRTGALHKLGRGSDQGDCVVLAAHQLARHQWPYVSSLMPTKNAMSCGPGWVALQTPAIALGGYCLDQLLLWGFSLFVLFRYVPRNAAWSFLALVGLSAGTWLSAADGNDFLPFGLLLAAVFLVLQTREQARLKRWELLGVSLLLACLAQFRMPLIFLPLFFIKRLGRVASIGAFSTAVACQTAFLLWDPDRFVTQGPMHVGMKLFRTGLGHSRLLASAEFLVPVVVGALCAVLIVQRVQHVAGLLLGYLSLLFALPAVQNLFLQYHSKGNLLQALGYWEGGNWIIGLLPLAALQLVLTRPFAGEATGNPAEDGVPSARPVFAPH